MIKNIETLTCDVEHSEINYMNFIETDTTGAKTEAS